MSANDQSITDDYGTLSSGSVRVSRPNVKPWRNISSNDIFLEAREIENEFELSSNSHMVKSAEWSVVAYLTEAIRDGEEVWGNNQGVYSPVAGYNKFLTTGCAESELGEWETGLFSLVVQEHLGINLLMV